MELFREKHNLKVLEKKEGDLIVRKRPADVSEITASDYRACPNCYGCYNKSSIRIHMKECAPNTTYSVKEVREFYTSLASTGGANDVFNLLLMMQLAMLSRGSLIQAHGRNIFEGYEYSKQGEVSQRMRRLGRLLLKIREMTKEPSLSLTDLIIPRRFDDVAEGVRALCNLKPGEQAKCIPSTALKIGHDVKHCTNLLHNMALRTDDTQMEKLTGNFRKLHETEWGRRVSKKSLITLEQNKKHDPIPFTADVVVSYMIIFFPSLLVGTTL